MIKPLIISVNFILHYDNVESYTKYEPLTTSSLVTNSDYFNINDTIQDIFITNSEERNK